MGQRWPKRTKELKKNDLVFIAGGSIPLRVMAGPFAVARYGERRDRPSWYVVENTGYGNQSLVHSDEVILATI